MGGRELAEDGREPVFEAGRACSVLPGRLPAAGCWSSQPPGGAADDIVAPPCHPGAPRGAGGTPARDARPYGACAD